ncbi:FAD-binding oxidoreductase [Alkalihalobacillus oceani]|uniref:FAD-binding oxidoreductase n=1 Tax=Halalkalibacter oceani TaxID=1653776 RepID=A0A9X2DR66_9BACI|nr:FAD-binding oxidoreductase [Halalkalibacter oceani]MCM3714902.1 FAD-binding oxidoreductase [Halalkalibacter oceani]
MIVSEEFKELKTLVPEQQIEEKGEEQTLFGNEGRVAVYPKTEQEIVSVLTYANDNGKSVTVAGRGTKKAFGGVIAQSDLLLSLENYTGIIEHTVGNMTLTVRAGTRFQDIQDYLAAHKQMIPLDPFWPDSATIGGIVAANDSGPKRLGYGSARDAVIGMKLIYPDGRVIRAGGKVVKNVAGYDMNKLFIGSMGTLAVISEITFKLSPIPKEQSLILLAFAQEQLEEVRKFAVRFLDSALEPVALELFNPTLAKAMTRNERYTLAISFEDVKSSVRYQEEFTKQLKPAGAEPRVLAGEDARNFWKRFYELPPNGLGQPEEHETEAILKIGVKNLDVLQVIRSCHMLEESHHIEVAAHGGLGHGLSQVVLKGAAKNVITAIDAIQQAVTALSGYVIVKHIPLSIRKNISVWGEEPSYFFLLEGMKAKIDPNKILNPKRFVGGM